jgi:hypothetical protein
MSMVDGKIVREGVEGLEEKAVKKLTLADKTTRLFPKNPVAPGESWDVQGDDVKAFLDTDDEIKDGKIKIKFDSVKDIDGKKCALLKANIEATGKVPGDIDMIIKLDADVVVWLDRGYTLSVKGKGTVSMKAEHAQFKISGEGPLSLDIGVKVE